MEVAADAQVARLDQFHQPLADRDRAVLVKGAMVAEAVEIKLERLRFDKPAIRHVIDHQDGEVGLPGDRAERGEFREREARRIGSAGMRIGDAVERRLVGRGRKEAGLARLEWLASHRSGSRGNRAGDAYESAASIAAGGVARCIDACDGCRATLGAVFGLSRRSTMCRASDQGSAWRAFAAVLAAFALGVQLLIAGLLAGSLVRAAGDGDLT